MKVPLCINFRINAFYLFSVHIIKIAHFSMRKTIMQYPQIMLIKSKKYFISDEIKKGHKLSARLLKPENLKHTTHTDKF